MNKIVNNIAVIRQYVENILKECSVDSVIQIQIMQRRKDEGNENLPGGTRTLKSYLIGSVDHFDKIVGEITDLCDYFHARAYINLNPKSTDGVRWNIIDDLQQQLRHGQHNGLQGVVDGAVAKLGSSANENTWIIDIDEPEYADEAIGQAREIYNRLQNQDGKKPDILIMQIPTVNGIHAIIRPFNVAQFKAGYRTNESGEKVEVYEIKKNAPTLLYANI